ncbi:hypothetical protein B9Z19DRAFT_1119955 [Tuber borchii]|uniref:Uncharacterized protein n=1 Tax=Tuber borchii TaxID=42251 RepID=A0A2T7A5G2_TUBBO|nr:hypothetical protein B9Z19DRAFT_1119955 [Tuber borchii]
MEINSNLTDVPGYSNAGHRRPFGSSHCLPSPATSSDDPMHPPHSQAPSAHLEYSQPAHLASIQSAGSFSSLPTGSIEKTAEKGGHKDCRGEDSDEENFPDETQTEATVEAAVPSLVSTLQSKRKRESDNKQAQQQLQSDAEKYPLFCSFLAPKGSKIPVNRYQFLNAEKDILRYLSEKGKERQMENPERKYLKKSKERRNAN